MGHHDFPQYKGVITSATAWGSMMIRIVTFGNSTDLDEVLQIESQIEIKPIRRIGLSKGPTLTSKTLQPSALLTAAAFKEPFSLNESDVTEIMSMMAAVEEFNPPANRSDYRLIKETLREAGVSDGKYTPPHGLNLTLSLSMIEEKFSTAFAPPTAAVPNTNFIELGNSWLNFVPSVSGDFSDTNPEWYVFRAYIAFSGYLQLVSTEAIYPEYDTNTTDGLTVTQDESYIVHFSGSPPTAFWSLTPYADNYLIPNPLNRFSLHERSNITFAADGSYDILLQAANVTPPSNWTDNWLPAPSDGGSFTVNCESHVPFKRVQNADAQSP
jgi:hypothetical protein